MPECLDQIKLTYALTFKSPFHCGSGFPRGLIDRAVQRDANGYPFVPGATLKGVLRERCEQLARLFGLERRLLHKEDAAIYDYKPSLLSYLFGSHMHPGGLHFDDAQMCDECLRFFHSGQNPGKYQALQTLKRTQVSLSRRTGAAKPGFLFSSEFGWPDLRFEGAISGYVRHIPLDEGDEDLPTYPILLLLAGLTSLDRIGGGKSTGAGRCLVEQIELFLNNIPREVDKCLEWLEFLGEFSTEVIA